MKDRQPPATDEKQDKTNAPTATELLISEIRRTYCAAYISQTIEQGRSLTGVRSDLASDVDYDEREDCLYIWYEDPTLTSPSGGSFESACLTSYPDTLNSVSTTAPQLVLSWVRERAAAHSNYDAMILQYNSSTLLKPKLMFGVRYVQPKATKRGDEKQNGHGTNEDEIF